MTYFIDDYNQHQIVITDLWRTWTLPKFTIAMEVSGDYVILRWSDLQNGSGGSARELRINYLDVVDGYSGYVDNPASATALMSAINTMIVSGFTSGGGDVLIAKADLLSHNGVSDERLPGGANESVLIRNNGTSTGLDWVAKTLIYSDENAQDAVGSLVGVGLAYDDVTGSVYSTGSAIFNQIPTGAINGINTVYTTASSYKVGSVQVFFKDGGFGAYVMLDNGVDFTETGAAQITLSFAPSTSSKIILNYIL